MRQWVAVSMQCAACPIRLSWAVIYSTDAKKWFAWRRKKARPQPLRTAGSPLCLSPLPRAHVWPVARHGKPQCVWAVITVRTRRPGGAFSGNDKLQWAKPIIFLVWWVKPAAIAVRCLADGPGEAWCWPPIDQLRAGRDLCKQTPWGITAATGGWAGGHGTLPSIPQTPSTPPALLCRDCAFLMQAEWDGALRWLPLLCGRLQLFKPFASSALCWHNAGGSTDIHCWRLRFIPPPSPPPIMLHWLFTDIARQLLAYQVLIYLTKLDMLTFPPYSLLCFKYFINNQLLNALVT